MHLFRRPPRFRPSAQAFRTSSTSALARCPKCSAPLASALPACSACHYLGTLPADTRLETVLGLAIGRNPFQVDTKQLRSSFLAAQRVCHPDMWSGHGEEKAQLASNYSALVNAAYRTLKDPLSRAEYILSKLSNLETKKEDLLEDTDLVSEVLELREEVEGAQSEVEITRLREQNQERMSRTENDIGTALSKEHLLTAKAATIRLRYWRGIADAIRERGAALGLE